MRREGGGGRWVRRVLVGVAGVAGGLAALGWGLLTALTWEPAPVEVLQPQCDPDARPLRYGDTFSVLAWNIQFGAGRGQRFFYDGGEAVDVPDDAVDRTLAAMARVLAERKPDLVLLQEVDRDSRRTGRVDELQRLREADRWACVVSAPYFRAAYVPHPPHRHLGRMDMHLAILSRLRIDSARRLDLPRLRESFLRRAFNLKRAILEATVPIEGGPALRVGNTHLSAFSYGDGTLERQVGALLDWMGAGTPFLLGGDFNLLPPGDDPGRLGEDARLYADRDNPLERITARYGDVSGSRIADPAWRTWLPHGSREPDRRIDYLFHDGPALELVEARVLREHADLSDHLPLWAVFRVLPPGPVPGAGPEDG